MVVTGIIILVDQWKKQTTYQVLQSDPFEVLKWRFLDFSDLERRTRYQVTRSSLARKPSGVIKRGNEQFSVYR